MKRILLLFAICFAYANLTNAQQWEVPGIIIAGGNDFGQGSNQLSQTMGITADNNGTAYVSDLSGHRIQKWEEGATEGVTVAGGIGWSSAANGLALPTGVWLDDDNTLYISDSGNSRIQMWTEGAAEGVTVAGGNGQGNQLYQLNWQGGIFKKGNDLYIVDGGNSRVLRWTIGASEGVVVAGGNGFGSELNQLGIPTMNGDVFVDDEDNVYVSEYSNDRVTKWAPGAAEGVIVANIAATGNTGTAVSGIWVLEDGKLVIAYGHNSQNRITLWENGEFLYDIVSKESEEVRQPTAIFLDANRNLYVSDYGNNRAMRFNYICALSAAAAITETSICAGEEITLTVTPSEETAVVNWYAAADGTEPIYTGTEYTPETLTETTTYWVEATNHPCITERIQITVTVNPLPVLELEDEEVSVCYGTEASLFGTSAGHVIFWYADESDEEYLYHGNLFVTPELTESTSYWVEAYNISTGCSSERVEVVVTVIPAPAAPTAVAYQHYMAGQTLADLVVESTGTLTWYADEALTIVLPETTPLVDGTTYYVTQTTAEGCESEAVSITVELHLGISGVDGQDFIVYPNPTAGIVKIQSKVAVANIEVFNIAGQAVTKVKTANEVNISGYPGGTYILRITLENGEVLTQKVIKK